MKKNFLRNASFLTSMLFTFTLILPVLMLVNVSATATTTNSDVVSSSTTPAAVTVESDVASSNTATTNNDIVTSSTTPSNEVTTNNNVLPPSNLAYNLTTPDDLKLTWSSVYGATGYNVYGITDGQLQLIGKTTTTSYTISNLSEGSYSYVVSTLSADGESGPCAPVSVDVVYPDYGGTINSN